MNKIQLEQKKLIALKQGKMDKLQQVIDSFDELQSWINESPIKQLVMYYGCYYEYDNIQEAEDYAKEHFPDLIENEYMFETLAKMSEKILLKNQIISSDDEIPTIFYEEIGYVEEEEEDDIEEKQPKSNKIQDIFTLILGSIILSAAIVYPIHYFIGDVGNPIVRILTGTVILTYVGYRNLNKSNKKH